MVLFEVFEITFGGLGQGKFRLFRVRPTGFLEPLCRHDCHESWARAVACPDVAQYMDQKLLTTSGEA